MVKFQDGIEYTVGWFTSIGLLGFMAYGVGILELIGGLALIVGLGTRIVSALFSLLMIVAILKVKLSVGVLGNGQMAGYELDLAFIAIALYLALNDSKLFTVGQLFSQKEINDVKKAA